MEETAQELRAPTDCLLEDLNGAGHRCLSLQLRVSLPPHAGTHIPSAMANLGCHFDHMWHQLKPKQLCEVSSRPDHSKREDPP